MHILDLTPRALTGGEPFVGWSQNLKLKPLWKHWFSLPHVPTFWKFTSSMVAASDPLGVTWAFFLLSEQESEFRRIVELRMQSGSVCDHGLISPLDQQSHVRVRIGSGKQARCVMCRHNGIKTHAGWDILTQFKCDICQVPLCRKEKKDCFQVYHTMLFSESLPHNLLPLDSCRFREVRRGRPFVRKY